MTFKEIHLEKLHRKIGILNNKYFDERMTSNAYNYELSNLLLYDTKVYAEEIFSQQFKSIKRSKKNAAMASQAFAKKIEDETKEIWEEYLKISKDRNSSDPEWEELNFEEKFNFCLDSLCDEFEIEYVEYCNEKENNKQALKMAKSAKRRSWCAIVISGLTLLVAIIALILKYRYN